MKKPVALVITLAVAGLASTAFSAGDGQTVFRKCAGCHRIGDGAENAVGPVLTGVIGRRAGTYPGYGYSKYMIAAGRAGLVWDESSLFEYLADPTKYLRKVLDDPKARAKMRFRLKSEDDRRAVIDYLATFSTASGDMVVPQDAFCVVNSSDKAHFFAIETREGARQLTRLDPGARLCSKPTEAEDGVVSVFESEDGFEGCSRIVPVGMAEEMREYAEFDRCLWSSHDG